MAGSWPPVIERSQVVLFLAQYRRGERSNLFTAESLFSQSPEDHCLVLEAFATSHTWRQDDRGLHLLSAGPLLRTGGYVVSIWYSWKVSVPYQSEIQLPRFALQNNAGYRSAEKSECPRGSSVYVPFLLCQEPSPVSFSLGFIPPPLTLFLFFFFRENNSIIRKTRCIAAMRIVVGNLQI